MSNAGNHVAINRDSMCILGVGSYRVLSILSVIHDARNVDIVYASENKSYSRYSAEELQRLHRSLVVGSGSYVFPTYAALLEAVRAAVMRVPVVQYSEAELESYANATLGPAIVDTPARVVEKKVAREKAIRESKPVSTVSEVPSRPKLGTATGRVWEIADSLSKTVSDKRALKDAVVNAAVQEGINPSTAGVQFGKWHQAVCS